MADPNDTPFTAPGAAYRDGTSQAGRVLAALDPASALVDDRDTADWLRLLYRYARDLRYYDLANAPAGDWSRLFPFSEAELDIQVDEAARFLASPEAFPGRQYDVYRRPHFALLLAFLEMLRPVRERVNEFTRRHLEFYFREVLKFAPKPGLTGRVHVLIEPTPGSEPFLLPQGTLLLAGQDEQGQEVHYRTDANLVVNQARVARLMSVHVERSFTGLDDLRRDPTLLQLLTGLRPAWWDASAPAQRPLLALLQVALGQPIPGGTLSSYDGRLPINGALLRDLEALLRFVPSRLGLSLHGFRDLMALRRRLQVSPPDVRENRTPADAQWDEVNRIIEQAANVKRGRPSPPFQLEWEHRDDFETNLNRALNLDPGPGKTYGGLLEVDDIYGLARRVNPAEPDSDYCRFVTDQRDGLAMSLADFTRMMRIVDRIHEDWRRVLDILRAAGRRRAQANPGFQLAPVELRRFDSDRWNTFLTATLGSIGPADYPRVGDQAQGSLDDIDAELDRLEATFHLPAPDFARLRRISSNPQSKPWEWADAFALLRQARRQLELTLRRDRLLGLRDPAKPVRNQLERMVLGALADPRDPGRLPGGRSFFELDVRDPSDAAYIREQLFLAPENVQSVQEADRTSDPARVDWEKIAVTLDQALCHREGWTPAALEFESWQNLYAAPDATKVLSTGSAANDTSTPRWRTFGDGPRPDATTAPGALGFLIASPVLALAEGARTVELTLRCSAESYKAAAGRLHAALPEPAPANPPPFAFRLSTAKGWFDVPDAACSLSRHDATATLQFELRIDEAAPAIAAPPLDQAFGTTEPLLQVLLRDLVPASPPTGAPTKRYDAFRGLLVESLRLTVRVQGLAEPGLQTNDGRLDPRKPFEPFGVAPVAGSRLLLVHPEICSKRLDSLSIALTWQGLPADLATHYANYSVKPGGQVILKLADGRRLFSVLESATLFPPTRVDPPESVLQITAREIAEVYPDYAPARIDDTSAEPLAWRRHWELELGSPDFQHAAYPAEAMRAALNKTTVNPPYNPRAKHIRLSYSSSVELQPADAPSNPAGRLLHLEPFGSRPAPVTPTHGWPLLPDADLAGELYLGIEGARPPENLTLLFQMADGSADPELPPQAVRWSYLDGHQWRDLDDHHLLSDTTRGLLNTGIIAFALPPAQPGSLLPGGCYWIRAAVARQERAIGDLVAIHTQAVIASRVLPENASAATGFLLGPGQITGLANPIPEVASVRQPYSSFGGKTPEREAHFALRVSERLRHKDRALTCWDYERLVLEQFPDIHRVKCLPVGASDDPALAAAVQVIVVPDIRGRHPFDPFEPKVSTEMLRDIETFLAQRTPEHARVIVRNPRYNRLRLRFSVRLQPGCNAAFYLPRLNDEVCRYLSPWAYAESNDIVFGGRLSPNLIVYFVEQRPYVDYVANLQVFLEPEGGQPTPADGDELDLARLAGGAPDLIIVSAPHHDIDLITEDQYVPESFVGINFMKIELDFRVADDRAPASPHP